MPGAPVIVFGIGEGGTDAASGTGDAGTSDAVAVGMGEGGTGASVVTGIGEGGTVAAVVAEFLSAFI